MLFYFTNGIPVNKKLFLKCPCNPNRLLVFVKKNSKPLKTPFSRIISRFIINQNWFHDKTKLIYKIRPKPSKSEIVWKF